MPRPGVGSFLLLGRITMTKRRVKKTEEKLVELIVLLRRCNPYEAIRMIKAAFIILRYHSFSFNSDE